MPLNRAAAASSWLAALAHSHERQFGSANFAGPAYRALNAAQCGLMVPESEME